MSYNGIDELSVLFCRVASEGRATGSESESENSNSQAFEMVEKEDVDSTSEVGEKEEPSGKGTCVEELPESSSESVIREEKNCAVVENVNWYLIYK